MTPSSQEASASNLNKQTRRGAQGDPATPTSPTNMPAGHVSARTRPSGGDASPVAARTLPDDATILIQWAFKPAHMRAVMVDVLRVALRPADRGSGLSAATGEFSALDLEHRGADAHGGQGIAGSVIRQLLNHGVIAPVGIFVGGQFFPKTVRNDGGNPIRLYRLAKPGLARALLRAHAPKEIHQPKQQELTLT